MSIVVVMVVCGRYNCSGDGGLAIVVVSVIWWWWIDGDVGTARDVVRNTPSLGSVPLVPPSTYTHLIYQSSGLGSIFLMELLIINFDMYILFFSVNILNFSSFSSFFFILLHFLSLSFLFSIFIFFSFMSFLYRFFQYLLVHFLYLFFFKSVSFS